MNNYKEYLIPLLISLVLLVIFYYLIKPDSGVVTFECFQKGDEADCAIAKVVTSDEWRTSKRHVSFSKYFFTTPSVDISVTMVGATTDVNAQAWKALAKNITCEGFDVIAQTWGRATINTIRVNWIARC